MCQGSQAQLLLRHLLVSGAAQKDIGLPVMLIGPPDAIRLLGILDPNAQILTLPLFGHFPLNLLAWIGLLDILDKILQGLPLVYQRLTHVVMITES